MAKTRSRRFCSETMFPSQNTHWFGFPYKSFNNLYYNYTVKEVFRGLERKSTKFW